MFTGRKRPLAWRLVSVATLLAAAAAPLLSGVPAAAQETLPATAAAAPADTAFYYEIDLDFGGDEWAQAEALLARAGIPDVLDMGRASILEESGDAGDFTEADLNALLGGEMAFIASNGAMEGLFSQLMTASYGKDGKKDAAATPAAMEANPAADEALGVAAVLMPGDADAAWSYVERQMQSLAAELDATVEEGAYGDAAILWVEIDEKAMKKHRRAMDDAMEEMAASGMMDMGPWQDLHKIRGFAAGRIGDFIAAPSQADVEAVVEAATGAAPSLAESPIAQQVRAELPAAALSFLYFDESTMLAAMGDETVAAFREFAPEMPEPVATAGGMTVSADDPGFRLDIVSIPTGGAALPQSAMMNDPSVAASATTAPADAMLFAASRFDRASWVGLAYAFSDMVGNMHSGKRDQGQMTNPMPDADQIREAFAQAKDVLGFDPWDDLFAHLGEEVTAYMTYPAISGSGFDMEALLSVAASDPAALATTVEKLAGMAGSIADEATLTTREIGGDTVYSLESEELAMAPAAEFGVVGDRLVGSLGGDIENSGAERSPSLADDEQYQAVMAFLPQENFFVEYIDFRPATSFLGMMDSSAAMMDADPACNAFASQEEAQAAYDADPLGRSDLDADFDGEACEDAFAAVDPTPMAAAGSIENVKALAIVGFNDGARSGASVLLYIPEPAA